MPQTIAKATVLATVGVIAASVAMAADFAAPPPLPLPSGPPPAVDSINAAMSAILAPIDVVMHPLDVRMRPITGSTGFHSAAATDGVPDPTWVRTTAPQPLPGTIPRP